MFAVRLLIPPILCLSVLIPHETNEQVSVSLEGYDADSAVKIRRDGGRIVAEWPLGGAESARITLSLEKTLIESIERLEPGKESTVVRGMDPVYRMTVGTRQAPSGRPPEMSIWNTFFDKPASRPHASHVSRLDVKSVRVTGEGQRASIAIDDLTIGPFRGELQFSFFAGSPLIQMEAVVVTEEDRRAYIYDAGLLLNPSRRITWRDLDDRVATAVLEKHVTFHPLAVRNRVLAAEGPNGSLAVLPPPHQFYFPRDWTDNFKYAWIGRMPDSGNRFGFGVRQDPEGGGAFVPWFNGPPGTKQRLGLFLLISPGNGGQALKDALRYTRGDRFKKLPGYVTFTSHYHMAVAVSAMERAKRGEPPIIPDFVRVFKEMGVDSLHLGEFHGDGHQRDPGPLRLPEMEAMFNECRRLSDSEFLLMPGEELNDFLGLKQPGKHPGHWMSFFPKPVYFTQTRSTGQPLVEDDPRYGRVYHIGSTADMVEVMQRERGLAWTAHPRIKASSWTPDIFRNEPFYKSDFWLGAAWKAMPADLSREKLGERALDLLDDMSNWGDRKYLPGEVDVFKIDRTHELYGHMNVNYLRLDRIPRFRNGWRPILNALRAGRFFVTTGEVLIPEFTVGGEESGGEAQIPPKGRTEIKAKVEFTFPLRFAEIISGDGQKVHRQRLDLTQTKEFSSYSIAAHPDLRGRKWVRLEVWDIAANGAFTQPVWLTEPAGNTVPKRRE